MTVIEAVKIMKVIITWRRVLGSNLLCFIFFWRFSKIYNFLYAVYTHGFSPVKLIMKSLGAV